MFAVFPEQRQSQKQEEDRKRREAMMQQQRIEQQASLNIRRVMQQLLLVRAGGLEAVEQELIDVCQKDLPGCGSQAERVRMEAEQSLARCKERLAREEQQRLEFEQRRKETTAKAQEHLRELLALVEAAEAEAKVVVAKAEPVLGDAGLVEELDGAIRGVEEAGASAKERMQACTSLVFQQGSLMRASDLPPSVGEERSDEHLSFAKLLSRINETTKHIDSTLIEAKLAKEKALKRGAARKKMAVLEDVFLKYALKDVMGKKEVQRYAKGEFEFEMPTESVDALLVSLVLDGAKGVTKDRFQRLRVKVGIARERALDAQRREARLERERKLAREREGVAERLREASRNLEAIEERAARIEADAEDLSAKGRKRSAAALEEGAGSVERQVRDAREGLAEARRAAAAIAEGLASEELRAWLSAEEQRLGARLAPCEARLLRASSLLSRCREEARRLRFEELAALEAQALRVLRLHGKEVGLRSEALFDALDSARDGRIDLSEWLAFFAACNRPEAQEGDAELTDDALTRLFGYLEEESQEEGSIPKEQFAQWIRHFMKVCRESVLTSGLSIKEGSSIRRLECGEVVEILEGPAEEEAVKVIRVGVRAVKDGAEGWMTLAGNQGTTYLEEGGNTFRVVGDTILTETFALDGSGPKAVRPGTRESTRKLKVGELVEAREWQRLEEATGLMRMKCRCRTDGATGYATIASNVGAVFLQGA